MQLVSTDLCEAKLLLITQQPFIEYIEEHHGLVAVVSTWSYWLLIKEEVSWSGKARVNGLLKEIA